MSEYIEREAALKILTEYDRAHIKLKGKQILGIASIAIEIGAIPAADVRPVVLCRDCKHRDPEDHKCDCGQLERAGCVFPVDDDYFCAYGVKRDES